MARKSRVAQPENSAPPWSWTICPEPLIGFCSLEQCALLTILTCHDAASRAGDSNRPLSRNDARTARRHCASPPRPGVRDGAHRHPPPAPGSVERRSRGASLPPDCTGAHFVSEQELLLDCL